jgi:hypothetical protein
MKNCELQILARSRSVADPHEWPDAPALYFNSAQNTFRDFSANSEILN